jgi:hypothetical protein
MSLRAVATILSCSLLALSSPLTAQVRTDSTKKAVADSAFLADVERSQTPYKVLHAEPLFIDLIRDLGARKGESEWNVGLGMTDRLAYDEYLMLVEYEWAPIDRLGLEIEVPVTMYSALPGRASIPRNRVEGLKLAAQHTVAVSPVRQASLALGYLHTFVTAVDPRGDDAGRGAGLTLNPFVVGAKRWGTHTHTLAYVGTKFRRNGSSFSAPAHEVNTSMHWMITGTRNFVGVEVNSEVERRELTAVVRPQMRLGIADNLLVGIAVGVPLNRDRERLGFFLRMIYEPGSRHR